MPLSVITRYGNYFGSVTRQEFVAGLLLTETRYAKADVLPMHEHECPSFLLVRSGGFAERSPRVDRRLRAGDVVYHPAGDPHAGAVLEPGTHAFNIEVTPEWAGAAHPSVRWGPVSRWGDQAAVTRLVARIYRAARGAGATRALAIEELILDLAGLVAAASRRSGSSPPPWIAKVVERLRASGSRPPSIATMARHIGVDPSTLYRAFRRAVGCSPSEYLRALRLERACQALVSTSQLIGRIGHDCGFYDHAHFTRTFARLMDMTPGGYRAMVRPPRAGA